MTVTKGAVIRDELLIKCQHGKCTGEMLVPVELKGSKYTDDITMKCPKCLRNTLMRAYFSIRVLELRGV